MKYDLAVVGAGPAGSMAAYRAASLGLKVLLLEEHERAGSPPHCAGKLSVKAFSEFKLPSRCILNSVRGAVFHSPGGLQIQVSKPQAESHIVDRELLDARLAEEALNAGAEAWFKCKAKGVSLRAEGLRVRGEGFQAEASTLVLAEGGVRRLSLDLGLGSLKTLRGIQAEMDGVNVYREDFVEVFLGSRFFPGFFGWIIPLRDGRARVGLCVDEGMAKASPKAYLEKALAKHPTLKRKAKGATILKVYGGLIPVQGPARMWKLPSLMAAGDAAGHAKSTTGGGIFFSLKAGWLAGEASYRLLEGWGWKALKGYEEACLQAFGWELAFTRRVRRLLNTLSDSELDQFFQLLSNREILSEIERYGDTAYQSKVWKPLVKACIKQAARRPEALKLAVKVFPKILQALT